MIKNIKILKQEHNTLVEKDAVVRVDNSLALPEVLIVQTEREPEKIGNFFQRLSKLFSSVKYQAPDAEIYYLVLVQFYLSLGYHKKDARKKAKQCTAEKFFGRPAPRS